MFAQSRTFARLGFGFALAVVLSLAMVLPALAAGTDQTQVNQVLSPGALSITSPDETVALTETDLTGQTITNTASLDNFTATDATGSGAGWKITVQASAFTNGTAGQNLPLGSLSLAKPNVAADGTTSPLPSVLMADDTPIDVTSPVILASAAANEGMGEYVFDFDSSASDLTLTLPPATTYAGTYTSTITWTVVSGPEED